MAHEMAKENTAAQQTERADYGQRKSAEELYAEHREAFRKRFEEAEKNNEAFYQIDPKKLTAPVAGLPNTKGVRNPFRGENAAVLMQTMVDKGMTDARWISYRNLEKVNAIPKKGEKATAVVYFNQETMEPAAVVKYFNVEQLNTKDRSQSPIKEMLQPVGPARYRDTVAQNMAMYLHEHIHDKDDIFDRFAIAPKYGYDKASELDKSYTEKRVAAIDAVDLDAEPKNLETLLMQEAKKIREADPELTNYMYKATVEVLKTGKYQEKAIAEALNKVSPTPAGLNFDKGYGERTVAAAKEDRDYKRSKMVSQGR